MLPIELQRLIIRFIPRNNTAELIHKSKHLLSLNYVRKIMFDNPLYKSRIWQELKPVQLRSIFYGDTQQITRNCISKGEWYRLRRFNIVS